MDRRVLLLSFSLTVLININLVPCRAQSSHQSKQDEVSGLRLVLHGMKPYLTWELLHPSGDVAGYTVTWQDDAGNQTITTLFLYREIFLKEFADLRCSSTLIVTIDPLNATFHSVGSAETKRFLWQDVVTNVTLVQSDGMIVLRWSVECGSEDLKQLSVTLHHNASIVDSMTVTANTSSPFHTTNISTPTLLPCGRYTIIIQPQDASSNPIGVPTMVSVHTVPVSSLSLTPGVSTIHASWSVTCPFSSLLHFKVTWRSEDGQHEQTCQIWSHRTSSFNTNKCKVTLDHCSHYNVILEPWDMSEKSIGVPTTKASHTLPRNFSTSFLEKSSIGRVGPNSVELTWRRQEPSCSVTYVVSYNGTAMWGENKSDKNSGQMEEDGTIGWQIRKNGSVIDEIEPNNSTSDVVAVISNLLPFSSYTVCVSAEFLTQFGSNSCVVFNTREARPTKPQSLSVAAPNSSCLNVTWEEPSEMNGQLINYTVRWVNGSTLRRSLDTTNKWYLLEDLRPCEEYDITVTASTGGGEGEEARINGTLGKDCISSSTFTTTQETKSSSLKIQEREGPTPSTPLTTTPENPSKDSIISEQDSNESTPGAHTKSRRFTVAIVTGVLVGCLLVAAVGAVGYKRKSIQEGVRRHLRWRSASNEGYYDILQREIEDKAEQLGNTSTLEFEFDQLTIESYDGTTDVGRKPENAGKNLYSDVLPFDNHRVRIDRKEAGKTDYINASFVASPSVRGASFIACQGPIEGTETDFWWMVWEQHVSTIVMLEKCSPYWPSPPASMMNFGLFSVEVEKVIARSNYVLRKITLKQGEKIRELLQFSIDEWPEFRVSRSERELLKLLRGVRSQQTVASNVVVHCSSGAGKTGTFIGLWQLTLAAEKRLPNIDVKQTVLDMRLHRPLLVQDEEQYLYLHFSFLEYLRSTNSLRKMSRSRGGAQTDDKREAPQCNRILLPTPVDDFTLWTGYVTVDDSPPTTFAYSLLGYKGRGGAAEEVEMMPLNTASSTG